MRRPGRRKSCWMSSNFRCSSAASTIWPMSKAQGTDFHESVAGTERGGCSPGKTLHDDLREAFLAQEGLYARLMDRVAALESLQTLDRWEGVLKTGPGADAGRLHTVPGCTNASGQRPETVCRRDLLFKKAPDIPRRQGCGAGSAVADSLSPAAQYAG